MYILYSGKDLRSFMAARPSRDRKRDGISRRREGFMAMGGPPE